MEVVPITKRNVSGNDCIKLAVLRICEPKNCGEKTALTCHVTAENTHKTCHFRPKNWAQVLVWKVRY